MFVWTDLEFNGCVEAEAYLWVMKNTLEVFSYTVKYLK